MIVSDGQVYDDPYLYEAFRNEYRWSDGSLILIKEESEFSDNIKNPSHEELLLTMKMDLRENGILMVF